ncbi:hypothetical protein C478_07442 [Natrinema thermotolerans DSM 11552]|nr:hypothetical protein C478_07442 [Natrinema thermotolerans DSM 11552]
MKELHAQSQALVLTVTLHTPITIKELTARTGVTQLTVRAVLPRLVAKEYIDRDGDTLTPGVNAPEPA